MLSASAPDLVGTTNQVAWAEHIRASVSAEFDRVASALEARADTQAVIAILEEKRAEVMARADAGYFIQEWRELRDQVRLMITHDVRYKAIQAKRMGQGHALPANS